MTVTREYDYYRSALAGERLPAVVLDLDAFEENRTAVLKRAGDRPVRLGSKSIRVRGVLERLLASDTRYSGLLCFSADEAMWLAGLGFRDMVVAYPTVQEGLVRRVCAVTRSADRLQERSPGFAETPARSGSNATSPGNAPPAAASKRPAITLMVDSAEQVHRLGRVAESEGVCLPVCLDLDMSVNFPGLYFGVRRSPVHDVQSALKMFRVVQQYETLRLEGVMGYEAQIAGLPDSVPGARLKNAIIRRLKRRSVPEVHKRRQAVVSELRNAGAELRFVNGGGTGSLESTSVDPSVTELTAGSAFFSPVSFDWFEGFAHVPAMLFALEAARVPAPGYITCTGGGYIASGAAGADRLPRPVLPEGLSLTGTEGAGEVQTPLLVQSGTRAADLSTGDPVFFRHTKAGELCERFNGVLCIRDGAVVERLPTYRGEGQCFL